MSNKEFTFNYKGKDYRVIVTRKRIRSISYRYKDGTFRVSAPPLIVSERQIIAGLNKFAERLIKTDVRSSASGEDYIYIIGVKVPLKECGEISFNSGNSISYKNREDLDKKLKKWFLNIVTGRVRQYEQIMGIKKPYKVHIKKMTSRYGSNASGTHSLSFSMILMHYTYDVIDSVIIHELAHDEIKNHSKKFYDVVYKYCPDYKRLHTRLRKGEFQ